MLPRTARILEASDSSPDSSPDWALVGRVARDCSRVRGRISGSVTAAGGVRKSDQRLENRRRRGEVALELQLLSFRRGENVGDHGKYEGGRRRGWPAEISGASAWEDPIF